MEAKVDQNFWLIVGGMIGKRPVGAGIDLQGAVL